MEPFDGVEADVLAIFFGGNVVNDYFIAIGSGAILKSDISAILSSRMCNKSENDGN